jgi:galactose-1-phosphate uridylyltransferase
LLGLAAEFAHLHSQIVAAPGIGPELSRDLHRWVARAKAQLGVPAG